MPPAAQYLVLQPLLMAAVAVPLTTLKYSNSQQLITPELGKPEFLSIVSLSSTCSSTTKPSTSPSAPVHQSIRTPPGNALLALPRHCSIPPTITATTSQSQVLATFSKLNRDSFSSVNAPILDIVWEEVLTPSARAPILVLNPHASSFWPFGHLNPHPKPAWNGLSGASIVGSSPQSVTTTVSNFEVRGSSPRPEATKLSNIEVQG